MLTCSAFAPAVFHAPFDLSFACAAARVCMHMHGICILEPPHVRIAQERFVDTKILSWTASLVTDSAGVMPRQQ